MRKIRSKEEIMEQWGSAVRNATDSKYHQERQCATLDAVLETLLDIRDQLTEIKQVMPEDD